MDKNLKHLDSDSPIIYTFPLTCKRLTMVLLLRPGRLSLLMAMMVCMFQMACSPEKSRETPRAAPWVAACHEAEVPVGAQWSIRLDGAWTGARPAALDSGTLYLTGKEGEVVAVCASTGQLIWSRFVAENPLVSPGVGPEHIYVATNNGPLYALDKRTGATVWKSRAGTQASYSQPAYYDGRVFWQNGFGILHIFDAKTGRLINRLLEGRWSVPPGGSNLLFKDTMVVFGRSDGTIVALDHLTEEVLWLYETRRRVTSTPILTDDSVLVGSGDGTFTSLDIVSGRIRWRFQADGPIEYDAVQFGDLVVFATRTGSMIALDIESGDIRWSEKISRWPGGLAVWEDYVLLVDQEGALVRVSASGERHDIQKRIRGASSPLVVGNLLFTVTGQSCFAALTLGEEKGSGEEHGSGVID